MRRDDGRERLAFRERVRPDRRVPVGREFPSDTLTPVRLFRRMRGPEREAFLLESVEGGESIARYTFLGVGPAARLTVRDGRTCIERDGRVESPEAPPLEALQRLAAPDEFETDATLPPLCRGAVGYLSYDAVRLFEAIPARHPPEGEIPDALFLLFEAVAAFDHPRQRLHLLTTLDPAADGDRDRAVDDAMVRLDRLEALLDAPDPPATPAPKEEETRFRPGMPRERFLEAVAETRDAIAEGEVYQAVISQRWTARLAVDPFDVYRALRALNPSPYLYYLETREATILGSSPEMLVRCRGRQVETRPIAGTAPRGHTHEEDEELAARLRADPKERAEHVMLVDLSRNDLGRVCEVGSVEVARFAEVERFSHVQHLVTDVRGRLRTGARSAEALAACFPAGTLTGAPKIRAMELIDALESCRRGIYGGAVGYFDAAGNCDLAIAIRTAVVERGVEGEVWRVQAGAGIVADSVAEKEYAEAEAKAAALFRAIDLAREWFT